MFGGVVFRDFLFLLLEGQVTAVGAGMGRVEVKVGGEVVDGPVGADGSEQEFVVVFEAALVEAGAQALEIGLDALDLSVKRAACWSGVRREMSIGTD